MDSPAEVPSPARSPSPDLPLTMTASVPLPELPHGASAALASAAPFASEKVVVRFKPVGAAPALSQDVCKISSSRKFEEVVRYLRRKLKCKDTDSVFLYVNSAFAPSLDEVVGNLHQVSDLFQDSKDRGRKVADENSASKMVETSLLWCTL